MPRNKYTKELLVEIVAKCKSWAEVCRELGIPPASGSQTHLTKKAKQLGVDSSHFLGQSWNRGKEATNKKDIQVYLNNEYPIKSASLRKRLIKEGYKEEKCEGCGLTEWMGEPIELELDHLNSNHFDNRLDNLWIACPNCHALETKRRRMVKSKKEISTKSKTVRIMATCKICFKNISYRANHCKGCTAKMNARYKIMWPTNKELLTMIKETNLYQVSKKLGVSWNAVKKRVNKLGV